jgi:hypothetical protein
MNNISHRILATLLPRKYQHFYGFVNRIHPYGKPVLPHLRIAL